VKKIHFCVSLAMFKDEDLIKMVWILMYVILVDPWGDCYLHILCINISDKVGKNHKVSYAYFKDVT
jgi:hypothetical protein